MPLFLVMLLGFVNPKPHLLRVCRVENVPVVPHHVLRAFDCHASVVAAAGAVAAAAAAAAAAPGHDDSVRGLIHCRG